MRTARRLMAVVRSMCSKIESMVAVGGEVGIRAELSSFIGGGSSFELSQNPRTERIVYEV